MRTTLACSVTLLVLATGSVSAQGLDWGGVYGGVAMATSTGSHEYVGEDDFYDLEGPNFGAFAGYMWDQGNLTYGAEVAASRGGIYEVTVDGVTSYKDEYEYTRFLDVKGRVGYSLNNVLLYGTLGVSRARFISGVTESTDTTGMILGVGADYQIADRYFVGAEYQRRNFDFYDADQDVDIDAKIDSFSLRAGIRF